MSVLLEDYEKDRRDIEDKKNKMSRNIMISLGPNVEWRPIPGSIVQDSEGIILYNVHTKIYALAQEIPSTPEGNYDLIEIGTRRLLNLREYTHFSYLNPPVGETPTPPISGKD